MPLIYLHLEGGDGDLTNQPHFDYLIGQFLNSLGIQTGIPEAILWAIFTFITLLFVLDLGTLLSFIAIKIMRWGREGRLGGLMAKKLLP